MTADSLPDAKRDVSLLNQIRIIVAAALLLLGLPTQAASQTEQTKPEAHEAVDDVAIHAEAPANVPIPTEKFPSFSEFPPSGSGLRVQVDERRWVEFNSMSATSKVHDKDQRIFWRANGDLINPPNDFDPISLVPESDSDDRQTVVREVLVQVVGPKGIKAGMTSSGYGGYGNFSMPIDNEFEQIQLDYSVSIDTTFANHAYLEVRVTREDWEQLAMEAPSDVQILTHPNDNKIYVVAHNTAAFAWQLDFQRESEKPGSATPSMVSGSSLSATTYFPDDLRAAVREELRTAGFMAFLFEKDKPLPKCTGLRRSPYDVVRFENLSVFPGPKSSVQITLNGVPLSSETEPALGAIAEAFPAEAVKDPATTADPMPLETIQLTGKVIGTKGEPISDCWVGMFTNRQVSDESKTQATATDNGPILAYQVKTGFDGSFSILTEKTHFVFDGSFWAIRPDGGSGLIYMNAVWPYLQRNLIIRVNDFKGHVRVLDENDKPVADAEVVLEAVHRERGITLRLPQEVRELQKQVTDADGMVTFRGWPSNGIVGVAVTTERYGTQFLNSQLVPEWVTDDEPLTLKLLPTGRLSGRVAGFDPDQDRDLRFEIETEQYEGRPPLSGRAAAKIDDDGSFHVDAIAPGRLTFSSSLPPTSAVKMRFPRVPALKPGEDRLLAEVPQLEPAVVVRQRVIKSDTDHGIPDLNLRVVWGDAVNGDGSWRDGLSTKTDADGWWTAKVLSGKISVRISSGVEGFRQTSWFDGRGGNFVIPATDKVITLPPEEYVPSIRLTGTLQYSDGSPAGDWSAFGHPISWNDASVGGVETDKDGHFTWTYPTGYPPRLYKVSNQKWMTEHHFTDRYVGPQIISKDPLVLQIPEKPPTKE